jgi:hypothetical protein
MPRKSTPKFRLSDRPRDRKRTPRAKQQTIARKQQRATKRALRGE